MKKNRTLIKRSLGERIFELFNILLMMLLCMIMLYPILYVLFASFSDAAELIKHSGLLLKPVGFTTQAYKFVAKNPMVLRGYANTLIVLVCGVSLNLVLTSLGAYFLSRKNVKLKRPITLMIIFTMYFSGGMIPLYFTVKDLGLLDSYLAMILPVALSTYNMIIMRTSFESIPTSIEEAARIDGAGHMTILCKIILPLSKAVIAVIIMYYAVSHWNSWFNAMLFINDRKKFPLQLVLREILIQNDTSNMMQMVGIGEQSMISETIKYAVIIVSTVPILCIYPFVQKHFVQGVMIGAVKG